MHGALSEWLDFVVRWIHLISGISWIGNSFYFMWLDSSFEPLEQPRSGVDGELYMVHGGNYYHVEKQKVRPEFIPKILHWFMWEATLTWLSGFLLLILLYYFNGGVYLIGEGLPIQNPYIAVGVSLLLFSGCWHVYDFFWRTEFSEKKPEAATFISMLAACVLCWGLCQIFSGRGAFIHLGAIFATLMVFNVWIRILPRQKAMLAAARAGQIPDYSQGLKAKRRSTQNSYMTLPVLFAMISNHLPLAYGSKNNWIILILLCLVGGLVRHMMIQWNKKKSGVKILIPIGICFVMLILLTTPQKNLQKIFTSSQNAAVTNLKPVKFSEVRTIMNQRCVTCHSQHPTDDVFKTAPNGIMYDDPAMIQKLASRIRERVWVLKNMPLINKTKMTDEERATIGRWVEAGAKTQDD